MKDERLMTEDELLNQIQVLDQQQLATLIALTMHEMTISARDTYEAGTDAVLDAPQLRWWNERMHRMVSMIIDVLLDIELDSVRTRLTSYHAHHLMEPSSVVDRRLARDIERAIELLVNLQKK